MLRRKVRCPPESEVPLGGTTEGDPNLFPSAARPTELNLEEEGLLEVLKTREVLRTISLEADEETGELRVDRDRTRHKSLASFHLPLEDQIVLSEAMEKLNPLQRRVLYYLFFTDLTQMEAAKRIGISQKHVSRVLASSLGKLRALLSPSI